MDSGLVEVLPEQARLLHIGIPKTGTTALQRAAAAHRAELLRAGVCYPGRTVNHREAVCALMGRQLGWQGAGQWVPDIALWDRLVAEVAGHPGRSLISHEFAAECDEAQAARFRASLGEQVHVVVTLRGFAHLLGSSWQQYVKAGHRMPFDRWLSEILADPPRTKTAKTFYRRSDQVAVVRRWAGVVGADRVIVVIADKARPTLLTDAFEDLLGVPRGLLRLSAETDPDGFAANRALSWPEAELVRRLNLLVRKPLITWAEYDGLIRNGAVARMLQNRRPGAGEPPVGLPGWAAEQATAIAHRYAAGIEGSGVRVIGDLGTLTAPVLGIGDRLPEATLVPIDAAVDMTAGVLSAALGRGPFFDVEPKANTPTLRRLVRTRRGRRWLELAQRTATASPADLVVVAGLRGLRAVAARLGLHP